MRITKETLRVLRILCANPEQPQYGLEIIKATKVQAGTLYPILIRLEENGWVQSIWELIDGQDAGRPARRYYTLTEFGLSSARAELDEEQRIASSLASASSLPKPRA